jgi:hypothetical protein
LVAAVAMPAVRFGAEAGGAEPAADGFAAQIDGKLVGQGLGEVREVEVEAVIAVDTLDLLAEAGLAGIGRGVAAVAVTDAGRAELSDAGLEPEDLAAAEAEHAGRSRAVQADAEGLMTLKRRISERQQLTGDSMPPA